MALTWYRTTRMSLILLRRKLSWMKMKMKGYQPQTDKYLEEEKLAPQGSTGWTGTYVKSYSRHYCYCCSCFYYCCCCVENYS